LFSNYLFAEQTNSPPTPDPPWAVIRGRSLSAREIHLLVADMRDAHCA
jgi:hypothetical protein